MAPSRQPVLIRVDRREVGCGVPETLGELEGVTLQIEQLDVADYVLSPRIAVERKSSSDFASSILDRRLFAQVEQLAQAYDLAVFLVEGQGLYDVSNVHPNAIRGALSFLIVLGGVSVLRSDGPQDSALLLATMARHEQQGLGYEISYHPKRRSPSPELQMRYMVEDLPGIGPRMADSLLKRFHTLQALFSAGEEDVRRVPGIGPKRAQSIRELLNRSYPS